MPHGEAEAIIPVIRNINWYRQFGKSSLITFKIACTCDIGSNPSNYLPVHLWGLAGREPMSWSWKIPLKFVITTNWKELKCGTPGPSWSLQTDEILCNSSEHTSAKGHSNDSK